MATMLRFLRNEEGATAIEYCIIAGILSIAVVIGATSIGTTLNRKFFSPVSTALN